MIQPIGNILRTFPTYLKFFNFFLHRNLVLHSCPFLPLVSKFLLSPRPTKLTKPWVGLGKHFYSHTQKNRQIFSHSGRTDIQCSIPANWVGLQKRFPSNGLFFILSRRGQSRNFESGGRNWREWSSNYRRVQNQKIFYSSIGWGCRNVAPAPSIGFLFCG